MQKEFIPYEQALELKELGFDEECPAWYNNRDIFIQESNNNRFITLLKNCSAPLYQQAFRWFRKNHGLYSSIIFKKSYPDNHVTGLEWYIIICGGDGVLFDTDGTYTYEEAELACLKKLIEIVGTIEHPKHPSVISENGNKLLFDKEGNLIKELPQQETLYTEEQMIQASKYGYEFRDTTSFPEHRFEDSCINNTKQWLQSLKQPKKD